MGALIDAIDNLDKVLTNSEKISDAKPALCTVREQAEALEDGAKTLKKKHLALKASHAKEIADLNASHQKAITALEEQNQRVVAENEKLVQTNKSLVASQLDPNHGVILPRQGPHRYRMDR